jgi:Domain of unknown function (DUF4383)
VTQAKLDYGNKHLPMTYNQMFGYIFGIVYLAVGFAGYESTHGINLTASVGGRELQLFSVNPLHSDVHLAVGALLMISAFVGPALSRTVNAIVGFVYLLLAIAGPLITQAPSINILGLNFADDVLHALTAVTALTVVFVFGRIDQLQNA